MTTKKDIDEIEKQISSIKKEKQINQKQPASQQNRQEGMRAGMEFILSILVAAFIGHWIDDYFDTKPIITIIFILFGTAAGFMAIYKISKNLGASVGYSSLHNSKKNVKETVDKNSKE